jgi:DNA-binding transcriptional MerR regulator
MAYSKAKEADAVSVTQERDVLTTLLDDVAKLHEVAGTLPADDERAQALESVADRWLASAPGMRPSIAAPLLGLSEPTVRAWARRGILKIRSRKPRLLLDPASVLEVRQLVGELRQAGRTRDLLDEVYNRLADEQQLADPDLIESLKQMRRGEYVVRRRSTG